MATMALAMNSVNKAVTLITHPHRKMFDKVRCKNCVATWSVHCSTTDPQLQIFHKPFANLHLRTLALTIHWVNYFNLILNILQLFCRHVCWHMICIPNNDNKQDLGEICFANCYTLATRKLQGINSKPCKLLPGKILLIYHMWLK